MRVLITNHVNLPVKYMPYIGNVIDVYPQIDNHGDYLVFDGLPFILIPAIFCKPI